MNIDPVLGLDTRSTPSRALERCCVRSALLLNGAQSLSSKAGYGRMTLTKIAALGGSNLDEENGSTLIDPVDHAIRVPKTADVGCISFEVQRQQASVYLSGAEKERDHEQILVTDATPDRWL
ncbi:MAG: hypothetical protein Q9159_006098 [Coniocarpon cinnabarinum]